MTRRGATLIEVLVAIFVMGIGMLALLVLFPIGILTMRQAIQDDRAATCASAATAAAKMRVSPSTFKPWFLQADGDYPVNLQTMTPATTDGPSYPLLLDIVGGLNYGVPPFTDWVGGQTNGIRRLIFPDPSFIANRNTDALRWQISPDDIVFDANGIPLQNVPGVFERNSAYSWAFLVRCPQQGKPNVVELTVIVFNDRPLALNSQLQTGESQYNAVFDTANSTVTLTWGGATDPAAVPPPVSVGGWILDTTPVLVPDPNNPGGTKFGPPHARFYRVVAMTQTSSNSVDIEVQSPIKGFPLPTPPNPAPVGPGLFSGTVVIIEGIAEVFEKGPIQWQNQ